MCSRLSVPCLALIQPRLCIRSKVRNSVVLSIAKPLLNRLWVAPPAIANALEGRSLLPCVDGLAADNGIWTVAHIHAYAPCGIGLHFVGANSA